MPKSILMLDKIARFVFLGLCVLCLTLNSCVKSNVKPDSSRGVLLPSDNIEYVADIPETVETEADELEESDTISYDSEAATKTKITVTDGQKDTYQHSNCDPSTNKYKDYYIGSNSFEIGLTLSQPDTIVSIVNPTGFYTAAVLDASLTYVTMVITNNPLPAYKARNIKWVATFQNGKTANFYMKMIPTFSGNVYGSSEYHVNYVRWVEDSSKFNLNQHAIANEAITESYVPTKFDIFKFGTTNPHFAIISNVPVQKSTLINGVRRNVWVFKIRERNAKCDWKATTKTFKWYPGCRIPSANTSRDSSGLFYRSY